MTPNSLILIVDDPMASADFYADILGSHPFEKSATFAMFAMNDSTRLGLWSRHTVKPAASAAAGSCELCFVVDSRDAVSTTCADWTSRGIPILQKPAAMDFGYTFTAADPDGHRLRVYCIEMN